MRRAALVAAVFALAPAGCEHKREVQATVTLAPPDPLCHAFHGKIHGTSRCWTLDRAAGVLAPSQRRLRPGAGEHFECNARRAAGDLVVGDVKLHVTCTYVGGDTVKVRVDVVDDARFPALRGRTLDLGDGGFTDFVNVIARPRGDAIDFSVDFGVLD